MATRADSPAKLLPVGNMGIPDLDQTDLERMMDSFANDPAQLDVPLPFLGLPDFGGVSMDAAGLPSFDPEVLLFDLPTGPGSGSNDSQAAAMPLDSISEDAAAPAPPAPAPKKGRKPTPAERNRAAQKRFRERQKAKMAGMNGRLDELTAEVERLRAELGAARSRAEVLTKVVAIRDDQAKLNAAERQLFDMSLATATASNDKKAMIQVPRCGTELHPSRALLASGQLSQGTLEMPLSAAEVRAIKAVPAESFIAHWKELVTKIGDALVTLEAYPDPQDPSHKSAEDAIALQLNRMGEMCWLTAVFAPRNIHTLMASTFDGGASGARADDPEHWKAVAMALECTADQKRELGELRARYLHKMGAARAEGRSILARLKGLDLEGDVSASQMMAAEMLAAEDAAVDLKANLKTVHEAACELIATTLRYVLTPRQKARAIVDSYPFYPDINQIAAAVCQL